MIILEIEMEMFLPDCNESALKSEAVQDQGQRQFGTATWIFSSQLSEKHIESHS